MPDYSIVIEIPATKAFSECLYIAMSLLTVFMLHLSFLMHFTHYNCQTEVWGSLKHTCEDCQDQKENELRHLTAIQPDDQQQR
jgi:hypothetical protein